MNEHTKRGTGRTTRMLNEAARLAGEGRVVYIVAATESQARLMQDEVGRRGFNLNQIACEPARAHSFDWQTGRPRGAHPNCVVLIDHYAAEVRVEEARQELMRMIEEMTRHITNIEKLACAFDAERGAGLVGNARAAAVRRGVPVRGGALR